MTSDMLVKEILNIYGIDHYIECIFFIREYKNKKKRSNQIIFSSAETQKMQK